jgi:polyferredoxin/tetratricopeptide (TPR) repeat protein
MDSPPKHSRMSRWRAASLIAVYLLMGLHLLHWKLAGRTLAPVEPSETFDTLHLGIITVGFLFMVGAVLGTSIAGRFFCGWGCHILALQDLSAWILRTLRISTKPIRSRTLLWVPPLAAVYLFIWPQVQRWLAGEPLPALRVISDPDGWTSFTTTDLLRSFPGVGMTLFTFAICGFVVIYFLGSRSFCRYACPYGAIFAAAEQLSPLRIIAGPGECSGCGLCISTCKSNVRVVEEVQKFGAVIDVNCMKDLDCVSVCPTGALRYGATQPPLFRKQKASRKLNKPYDFSLGEDLAMGGVFLAVLPIVRDLYEAIPLLLALAISGLLAYFAVIAVRLWRMPSLTVANLVLKQAGNLTPAGRVFAGGSLLLLMFVLHSGLIRYHILAGEFALGKIGSLPGLDQDLSDWNSGGPGDARPATNASVSTAIHHFEQASRWGLVTPRGLRQRLAMLYLLSGSAALARDQLNLLLASDADDGASRLLLAQGWLLDGRTEIARQQIDLVVSAARQSAEYAAGSLRARRLLASAYSLLGDADVRKGDRAKALREFAAAIDMDPGYSKAYLGQGAMLAADGQWDAAAKSFKACVDLEPDSAAAHNNLAAVLVRLHREAEALAHYQRALALAPNNSLAHSNVGMLLVTANRLDEAEGAFRDALALEPNSATALAGLAEIQKRKAAASRLPSQRADGGNGRSEPPRM